MKVVAAVEFTGAADVHIPLTVPFVRPEGAHLSRSLLAMLLSVNDGLVSFAGAASESGVGEPGIIPYCRDQFVSSQDWNLSELVVQGEPLTRRSGACLVVTSKGLLSLQWLDPSVLFVQFIPNGMAAVASASDLWKSAMSVFYPKRKENGYLPRAICARKCMGQVHRPILPVHGERDRLVVHRPRSGPNTVTPDYIASPFIPPSP